MPKPPSSPRKTIGKGRVRGSRTGRPIMVLLDLFGRRWSLRILWELRDQSMTSRSLRTACDEASPTVLNERLKELREAGFISHVPDAGYGLTPMGKELLETLLPLHRFAERWGKREAN
jgi:DNA-binding HxlR family transcriptional regulator